MKSPIIMGNPSSLGLANIFVYRTIPSHDTFNRFFSALDPDGFEGAFLSWIKDISLLTEGETVSIDGKTLCGSRSSGSKRAVHIVSAWASANQLSLGQVKVEEKFNEITNEARDLIKIQLEGYYGLRK